MPKSTPLKKPMYPHTPIREAKGQGDVFSVKKTSSGKGNTQVSTPAAARQVKTGGHGKSGY